MKQNYNEIFREHIHQIYKVLDEKEGYSINREFFKKTMEIQEKMEQEREQAQQKFIEQQIEKKLPDTIETALGKIFNSFR